MAKGSDVMTKAQNRVRLVFQKDMCGKVTAELSLWHHIILNLKLSLHLPLCLYFEPDGRRPLVQFLYK